MLDLTTLARRLAFCLALVMAPAVAAAGDIPEAVRLACSDDYEKHCIKHVPGSEAGRECMADVFEKLSETCVAAIMNSDLVGDERAPGGSESAVAETAPPPVPGRRVARTGEKSKTAKTRTATKAGATRRSRQVRTAGRARPYRVRGERHASRRTTRRRHASRGSRIVNRIWRGKNIARRYVARALGRSFWY